MILFEGKGIDTKRFPVRLVALRGWTVLTAKNLDARRGRKTHFRIDGWMGELEDNRMLINRISQWIATPSGFAAGAF